MANTISIKNNYFFPKIQNYGKKFFYSDILRTISFLIILLTILFFTSIARIYLPKLYTTRFEGWRTPTQINASCFANDTGLPTTCSVKIMPLNDGRYRIAVDNFSNKTLIINADFSETDITNVVVRKGVDVLGKPTSDNFEVYSKNYPITKLGDQAFQVANGDRVTLPVDVNFQSSKNKFLGIKDSSKMTPPYGLVLDEVGFATNSLQQENGITAVTYNAKIIRDRTNLIYLCCIAFLLLSIQKQKVDKKVVFLLFCFSFLIVFSSELLSLWASFSPMFARDLRAYYGSGTVQEGAGSNLNYGLYMAIHIIQGHGPVYSTGYPPWERMPGYGFILSVFPLFMHKPTDLLNLAINTIFFQIFLYALAAGYFAWAASKIIPVWVVAATIVAITFLNIIPYETQIEGIMPAVVLFIAGNNCLFLKKSQEFQAPKSIPIQYHFLLHSGFLLWFLIRTDVIPAWAIVSLLLYAKPIKNWKYLLIPISLMLISGICWALWKQKYTHEFSMTTDSVGASTMVGLWEFPHKFIWQVSDGMYYDWADHNLAGLPSTNKFASTIALHQVLRFYLTFPIYVIALIWHKFMLYVYNLSFVRYTLAWLFVIATSFTINYKAKQTLLLAWPVLFNVPVFFLVFSSAGRFYQAPAIMLIASTIPLILDIGFYKKIWQSRFKFFILALVFGLIAWKGMGLDNYFIHHDKLTYWAPFLDPAKSTLYMPATTNLKS